MSDNKSVRKRLEKIYGRICMIEEAGIRYIPIEKRKTIRGYRREQDEITYHHIKEKHLGGKATVENGALIKRYNHDWLHSLPDEQKEAVNKELIHFKLKMLNTTEDGIIETDITDIPLEFNLDDCIIIPVYDNQKKPKFNRAKVKREFKRKVDEYYNELEDEEER